jgi:hypothetical protein
MTAQRTLARTFGGSRQGAFGQSVSDCVRGPDALLLKACHGTSGREGANVCGEYCALFRYHEIATTM